MNITVPDNLEKLVQEKVDSGQYASPSDVVCVALRLLCERDQHYAQRLNDLKSEIQAGLESGTPVHLDIEDVITRGNQRLSCQ